MGSATRIPAIFETMTVEIDHLNVKVLWEGLNGDQFRRVLYLPYVDGYVMLLVTDADGKTVDSLRADRISQRYLPEEYCHDVPSEYANYPPDPDP